MAVSNVTVMARRALVVSAAALVVAIIALVAALLGGTESDPAESDGAEPAQADAAAVQAEAEQAAVLADAFAARAEEAAARADASAVLADASALSSLGTRELAEGWAEAIKHGLILDSELFDLFEEHAESLAGLNDESTGGDVRELAVQVIKRSMAIKAEIVSQDERETLGIRTLLNYGHTIGHGIEAAAGYGEYMHGEAVSVGMMGAAGIGQTLGFTDPALVERQRRILQRFGLPVEAPGVDPEKVLAAMTMDKKTEAGSVKWVLLESLGKAVVSRDVPQELAQETVRALCST